MGTHLPETYREVEINLLRSSVHLVGFIWKRQHTYLPLLLCTTYTYRGTGYFIFVTEYVGIHHHHHHHIYFMELGHLLTLSGLTNPEVYRDSFCQLGSSISLPWLVYFEAFYLHVVSSFSCIPVICPKLVLFLNPLQFVHLFCNLSYVGIVCYNRGVEERIQDFDWKTWNKS